MSLANKIFQIRESLHEFPSGTFGSNRELLAPQVVRERDTLVFACSEQGTAPDNISFTTPNRCVIIQNLAASIPAYSDCIAQEGLSFGDVESLVSKYEFPFLIVCGHLQCGLIRAWLRPNPVSQNDIGGFRKRFERDVVALVDANYEFSDLAQRCTFMICEHVLCQIENLLTHHCIADRVRSGNLSLYGWVVDDETARIYSYAHERSAFVLI